ncbi:MAG: alpha-L-fucosidase [Litorimonas sp.]
MKLSTAIFVGALMFGSAAFAQDGQKSMDELWGETAEPQVNLANAERGDWFSKDKYSMFIHWGLYSVPAGEWKGKTYYGISEWLMSNRVADIPVDDYKMIASEFNPTAFDAKAWVQLAVDSGMKNIVITSKHHEGFAMYDSAASTYDIADASPFDRDPLKELADAAQAAGIGLGFYYSQRQDWYEQGGAGVAWDSPDQENDFEEYFNTKVVPQVTELLTSYGPIKTVWFDTPGGMTKEQSLQLVHLVRDLQPSAMINSRIGNGVGDFRTLGDHSLSQVNHDGLWETIDTTNNSWGYAWYDENWKSGTEIIRRLTSTVGRGGNYMINVGPTGKGEIPQDAMIGLRNAGEWLEDYGHTIYGASASPWGRAQSWGDITMQDNMLYLHVFDWPLDGDIHLSGLETKIASAKLAGKRLKHRRSENGWTTFKLPSDKPDGLIPVIEVKLKGPVKVDDTPGVDPSVTTVLNSAFAKCDGCKNTEIRWMQKFGDWNYANNLLDWETGATGKWTVDIAAPGRYLLKVNYSADDIVDFSEWNFTFKEDTLIMQALDTGERKNSKRQSKGRTLYRYRTDTIGIVTLPAGQQDIMISPKGSVVGGGINLQAISLTPVED